MRGPWSKMIPPTTLGAPSPSDEGRNICPDATASEIFIASSKGVSPYSCTYEGRRWKQNTRAH